MTVKALCTAVLPLEIEKLLRLLQHLDPPGTLDRVRTAKVEFRGAFAGLTDDLEAMFVIVVGADLGKAHVDGAARLLPLVILAVVVGKDTVLENEPSCLVSVGDVGPLTEVALEGWRLSRIGGLRLSGGNCIVELTQKRLHLFVLGHIIDALAAVVTSVDIGSFPHSCLDHARILALDGLV